MTALGLTLLFPCTFTSQELEHMDFTARHPAMRDLGEKLLLHAWSHSNTRVLGTLPLTLTCRLVVTGRWRRAVTPPAGESQEGLISSFNLAYLGLLGLFSIRVVQGTWFLSCWNICKAKAEIPHFQLKLLRDSLQSCLPPHWGDSGCRSARFDISTVWDHGKNHYCFLRVAGFTLCRMSVKV